MNSKQQTDPNKNILVIYQLPKYDKSSQPRDRESNSEDNILDYDTNASFSVFPNMPLMKYGFYYYIHQTKNKMELFTKPEFKNKELHKIVNAFEDIVPQEDFVKQTKNDKLKSSDDINSFSIKYFDSDRIVSRAFYKLWELIMMFPILKEKKGISTLHIAEAPGSFVQSVIYYRNKFFKDQSSTDRYVATSIEPEKKVPGEYVPTFSSDLANFKQFSKWAYKSSDLTKPDIIQKFILDNANSADFITADGGFNWKDENFQEQEAYVLLLCEIYCAIKSQKEGGSFIIKFFETFTELTVKMIQILRQFYSDVYITKPLLSRPSNSERYIVCLNYNKSSKNDQYLDKIYSIITEANTKPDKFLVDIFPEYQIDLNLDMVIKLSATEMSNEQHRQINEMITYFNDGNYYGDAYRKYLTRRRDANDFWISTFYPTSTSNLNATRQFVGTLIQSTLSNVSKSLNEFGSKLNLVKFDLDSSKVDKTSNRRSNSKSGSGSGSESESETESESPKVAKTKTKAKSNSKSYVKATRITKKK
jgi:23S rRNA U2552 (ribose-2'-O)-methylase RlmE/FtsJ